MTSIAKQSRHALETFITPEEVLSAAVAKGRFPAKRFRVEGASVGNSRLLNSYDADKTRSAYGGKIVELVTREMWLQGQALELPACVKAGCLVGAGKVCKTKSGDPCAPHLCRFGKAKATPASAAQHLPACGAVARADGAILCSAKAGEPCTTPKGKPRMPHKGRAPVVDQPGAML